MRNKGFTLIELLAVIVILAIIALIATPIILNIIGDTKESSVIRSGELYLSAVEQAVAKENLNEKFDPKLCIIQSDGNLKCSDSIIKIETNGSRPKSGMIIFENGKISEVENISLDGYILEMDKNQKLVNLGRIEDISPKGDYLMVNPSGGAETTFLGGTINRSQVEIITIKATKEVPSNAIASWDVSVKKDKSVMAWYTDVDNNNLYELYIGGEGGVKANPNSSNLFRFFTNVATIDLKFLDTSDVTNMNSMIYNCNNLTNLDLSHFDTSKVTNMFAMFSVCNKLKTLDLSSFNTSNVKYMGLLFYYCTNLTNVNVSSFDTSNVTDMQSMFEGCFNLKTINLSSFNTSNVKSINLMFQYCTNLTEIDLSSFDTSQVVTVQGMFSGCSKLTTLNLSKAVFTNVTTYNGMLNSTSKLTTITVKDNDAKTFIEARLADASKTGVTVTISA